MTARDDAIALLSLQCAATTYPTLDETALGVLIDGVARYTTWAPNQAYSYGDVVVPTVRNGHLYQCEYAGTSSGTEPAWPLYTSPDSRVAVTRPYWHGYVGPMPGSMVTDGPVVWIEHGPDTASPYDVRLATYKAWLQKVALASADYDLQLDRDRYSRSQVAERCLDMANRFVPTGIS
jgi:hypothetical protein